MNSVTQVVKSIKQPKNGYLNVSMFKKIELESQNALNLDENINPSLIGLAVDYMTRFITGETIENAFSISLAGATIIKEKDKAEKLLGNINGINKASVINACKLVGYDVCMRAGSAFYKDVDNINPDDNTINNIIELINRSKSFFEKFGPVIKTDITFLGGYTDKVSRGDADFLTNDTLWDFKVSKNSINKEQTLQLLIYYILGIHSDINLFSNIKQIGIFNPRLNIVYICNISNISQDIIKEIEVDIMGYSELDYERLPLIEVMKLLECSKYMVVKYYSEEGLPLFKEKNKYYISKEELINWLQLKKEQEEKEMIIKQIIIFITIIIVIVLFSYMIKFL